jgi:Ring finger domain
MENQILTDIVTRTIVNDMLNIYRDTMRNVRNPNRNFNIISSRYYNDPPNGGYQINEEHDYILPDNDDLSSTVLLEIVTRFGSPETDSFMKHLRRDQIKNIGKYKKIKNDAEICETVCPICLEQFKENEFYRKLDCSHCFHKRCIDRWFRKDHSDCPMCRTKVF